jgi:hypothetical protein
MHHRWAFRHTTASAVLIPPGPYSNLVDGSEDHSPFELVSTNEYGSLRDSYPTDEIAYSESLSRSVPR